jgi:hypothetical protein
MKALMKYLPDRDTSAKQIALLFLLSSRSSEDEAFGTYAEPLFASEQLMGPLKRHQERLHQLAEIISKRHDYHYLLPKNIPNSTSI